MSRDRGGPALSAGQSALSAGQSALAIGLLLLAACALPEPKVFPRYTEPIRQLHLERGKLAWDGVRLGMTLRQLEGVVGEHVPLPRPPEVDFGCNIDLTEGRVLGQRLRFELDGSDSTSRLSAVWLLLDKRAGELHARDMVAALRSRFPRMQYVPKRDAPGVTEATDPKPIFRLAPGAFALVTPEEGIYFGELCLDE